MKIIVTDYQHDKHPHIIQGSPEEVEEGLRELYPDFGIGVAYGDLYTLCKELIRSYVHIEFVDQKPEPKPHLRGESPILYPEDPWLREDDFPHQPVKDREEQEPENWD